MAGIDAWLMAGRETRLTAQANSADPALAAWFEGLATTRDMPVAKAAAHADPPKLHSQAMTKASWTSVA